MFQNIRYAIRTLLRQPGFTLIAVLTLALGLGANSAIFTYVDVAYLRPLPVEHPEELVRVTTRTREGFHQETSYLNYLDYRSQSDVFTDLAAYGNRGGILEIGGEANILTIQLVSGNYFSVLGINPTLGRALTAADNDPAASEGVVVISHNLWRQYFGSDPEIVGRPIRLSQTSLTVAGVAPPGFRGLDRFVDLGAWVPANMWPRVTGGGWEELESRGSRWFQMVGRLRPGVELDKARAQLTTIASRLAASYPEINRDRSAVVESENERRWRTAAEDGAFLMVLVVLVLLIACANVANLLLARADTRRRATAVRIALGARRLGLIGQMLTESLLIAAAGSAVGLLLAIWLTSLLPALTPQNASVIHTELKLDGRIVLFTVLMSFAAALLFGLLPAIKAARPNLVPVLKDDISFADESRRFPLRNLLVAAQIGFSLVLLAAAGLLLRSFLYSRHLRPGFEAGRDIVHFQIVPAFQGYQGDRLAAFYEEYRQRLQESPEIKQATYAARIPFVGYGSARAVKLAIPGYEMPAGEEAIRIRCTLVGPNYFNTLGIRMHRGRPLDQRDTSERQRVAVVNQTMANRFWPGQDPAGRIIYTEPGHREVRIIGVAEDSRIAELHEDPEPYLYFSNLQVMEGGATYALEATAERQAVVAAAKRELGKLHAGMPILEVGTLSQLIGRVLFDERLAAWLATGLGLLGLLLGTIGLYGVVALVTGRRTREVGIRMALGATRRDVFALVMGQGVQLCLMGIVVGLAGSLATTHLLSSRLHGVSAADPITFLAVAFLLTLVALIASSVPARRATRVEPIAALRYE